MGTLGGDAGESQWPHLLCHRGLDAIVRNLAFAACYGDRWYHLVPAEHLVGRQALCGRGRGMARAHEWPACHGEVLREDPHSCSRTRRAANRDLRWRLIRRGGGAGRLCVDPRWRPAALESSLVSAGDAGRCCHGTREPTAGDVSEKFVPQRG